MTARRATAALVLVTLLWGVTFPAIKALFLYVSPLVAVGLRFGLAGLVLAPTLPGLTRRELQAGLVIGALFAVGVAFQNAGLAITTPSRSAFIVALAALATPAGGALLLGHRVGPELAGRLLLALGGVYLLTTPGGGLSAVNRGDWLTLVSAGMYAAHILAVGHFARGTSIARVLAIQFLVTAAAGFGAAFAFETRYLHPAPGLLALLAYLIATSLVTFALQLRAQRVLSPNEAALIFTFEPVVAAGTSYLWLGEHLSAMQWGGGALIVLAVGARRRGGDGAWGRERRSPPRAREAAGP